MQTELCIVLLQYGIRRGFSKPNISLHVQCHRRLDANRWSIHNYAANQVFNYFVMFFYWSGIHYCFIITILEIETFVVIKLVRSSFVIDPFRSFFKSLKKLSSFLNYHLFSIYNIRFLTICSFSKILVHFSIRSLTVIVK